MVDVIINGQDIEGFPDRIKYVKQANDLADVTTVNSSYSYSNIVPKTKVNTLIFEGLGLVGDTSEIPYKKNNTQIIDNGAMIVSNGLSTVKSTGKDYKLIIQDGIIDFFRAIENKTIGNDLDLSILSHAKTDANIVASFTNPYYRYLIAEYNGLTVASNKINPDYQIPSVNDKYLFDKIMEYAGYTYEGLPDISTDWTTFPNPPVISEDEDVLRFDSNIDDILENLPNENVSNFDPQWNTPLVYDTDYTQLNNNWKIRILKDGNYKINLDLLNAELQYRVFEGNIRYQDYLPLKIKIYVNGVFKGDVVGVTRVKEFIVTISAGSILELRASTVTAREAIDAGYPDLEFLQRLTNGYDNPRIRIENFRAQITSTNIEIFDFNESFKDFGMTDFIKEVLFRKSLTPFPDVNEKHIKFKTLTQRLNTDNAIDWSTKYVKRTNEEYQFGSYAKENILKLRHDDQFEIFGDGSLSIQNNNLKDYVNIIQSKYLAPSSTFSRIYTLTGLFPILKYWEREIKVNDDDEQEIEYKPLKNRFYKLREEIINSSIAIGDLTSPYYPKASITGTLYTDVVNEYYNDWYKIFDSLRIHEIELTLNQFDVNGLVMDEPYWFEQEGAFYLLNRLIYESGKVTKGEFLKIKE